MQSGTAAVERVFREEYGRLIASLVRRFGDIDIAEEAAGEALVAALEKWPESGVPPNPGGWLTTTAGNRAIDRIRREKQRDVKHRAAFMYYDDTPHEHTGPVEDDRLRLLFTCCHPALAPEARIALTLRLLGGLTVAEIAQAFLVPETTMAQRITRAKKKIAAAKVPYRVPEADDLPERLGGVLAVLFLVFNEGYLATGEGDPVRAELTGEAIRLTRVLRRLLPEEPEVAGLLGLLVLTEARREARVRNGQLVPLDEQDRAGWDRALIAEGHDLVRECLAINRPGRYQILAAINAVHTDAPIPDRRVSVAGCRIDGRPFVVGVEGGHRTARDRRRSAMTHYLLTVHGPAEMDDFGNYGSKEEMEEAFAATGAFNDKLHADGYWVFAGGLQPASTATVVDGQGETPVMTDGPYLETKEVIGGFWVIDAPDLDVALRLAAEGSKACRGKVEVRPFDGLA